MKAVAGIFTSRKDAERVADKLGTGRQVTLLLPEDGNQKADSVPLSSTEQPGMGKALAGTVGAAVGATGGLELGTAISAILPGVRPVVVTGFLGAAILGLVGVGVGAAMGGALENAVTEGLPEDEIFVYEDALRQGRTVVIALAEDEGDAQSIRSLLAREGAETIDAAREKWWIGLRDAEREHYTGPKHDFQRDEVFFRLGFQAALHARMRGKEYDQVQNEMTQKLEEIKAQYPGRAVEEPFQRGYERGRAYYESLHGKT